jgi:serine/threonine protein kinase
MTATVGRTPDGSAARLQPGLQLGEYRLGQPLWPLRIADAYRADGPAGPVTLFVIHARIAAHPGVREQVINGTRVAAALPEHRHLVKTLAAGLTGDILWIAAEDIDGSLVRELLEKKRAAGTSGLGLRASGNLITGITNALVEIHHGAISDESVAVNRMGRVRVIDLALGPGTLAAMQAGLIPVSTTMPPECKEGAPPSGSSDVYAIGCLLYEVLVGQPLARGGPRPSDVVADVNKQIDEVVARACHRDPEKRFGRVDVLGEVVSEALNRGGAMMTSAVPTLDRQPALEQQVSLASELASPQPHAVASAAASAGMSLDRVLAAALADTTEKWLVSKGRLDYGPFSLADIVTQIERGDIVAGNVIMDKDTGARSDVGAHPLLGPMVEVARQKRDDARRAQAEVAVQSKDKKRGVVLYLLIVLGLAGVGAAVYFIIQSTKATEKEKIEGVSALEGASLKVSVSMPKKPPPRPRGGGGGRPAGGGGGGGGGNQGTENLSLDLSDEGDEGTETLDMGRVYSVYSKYGGQLGGCLQSTGSGSANIYINIDGKSGKVSFVKINGQTSGPLFGCMNRVLRGMKFPSINGPRTRAEFDISM